jgi:hypothetical protein
MRYLLMAVITVVLLLVLEQSPSQPQRTPVCHSMQERDRIRELTMAAIDQALMNHVAKLFDVWLKDFSPEPTQATRGMANGISAYRRATANAMKWDPPIC